MADNFDDKNLFGDSFDFLQSDSNSLFGDNKKQTANANLQAKNQAVNKNQANTNFAFDDNLFGGGLDNNLFGDKNSNKNLNTSAQTNKNNLQVNKTQAPTNIDFGFDDNNLFGETALPKAESKQQQSVPTNLFDTSSDNLFGEAEATKQANVQESVLSDNTEQNEVLENAEQEQEIEQENIENNEDLVAENIKEENLEKIDSDIENKEINEKNKKIKNNKNKTENKDKKIKENKVKEEKTEEEKEKDKKRNKLIIIISSVVLAVVLAIILIVVLTNRPGEKLNTPSFNVYQRESGTVLIVDEQKDAFGYEIVISQTEKQDAVFSSKSNTIELRLYLNEPGIFNVKVRVLGNSPSTHSDFSVSKQVANYVKLDTPILFKDGNIISWNNVNNAIAYKLYYRANVQDGVVDFVEIPANKSEYTFDLTQLEQYGAGLYPICVEAIASGEFRLNSDYSQTIDFAYCAELDKPLAVVYEAETQKLTFATIKNKTQANKYLVVASLDNGTVLANHYVFANELEKQDITYQGIEAIMYTASLSELLSGEPINITIKALGDGIYTFDSEIVQALTI